MIDIFKLSIVLTITGIIAALLIAFTNSKTEARILEQQIQAQNSALKEIMPDGVNITEIKSKDTKEPRQYWIGINGIDTNYAFKISSQGYSSTLIYLVCINAQGIIKGMNILDQNETPGLGTRVKEVLSDKYIWNGLLGGKNASSRPWFTEQFKGINIQKEIHIEKNLGEWHKVTDDNKSQLINRNAITAITGSTISTRAVVNGITTQAKSYLSSVQGK